MKKTFILLFFALTVFSCSKDESETVTGTIAVNIKILSPKDVPSNVNFFISITPVESDAQLSNINWDESINYDLNTIKLKSSDIIYGKYQVVVSLNYPTSNYTYTHSENLLIQVLPNEVSKIDIEF